jgi:hypothetical protein
MDLRAHFSKEDALMASNVSGTVGVVQATGQDRVHITSNSASVPWYIWMGVLAVTSASIGGSWDVSWHRSIGRDTFWTPAHLAIYACGVLAGVMGLWLVVQCTFVKRSPLRAVSVAVFGLRAPLGVFLAGWGGVAILTSAPFDNWWHNAYGLDVKIISPPHTLLILGLRAVSVGVLFLTLAAMNRAAAAGDANFIPLRNLFLYVGGLVVGGQMFFLQEFTTETRQHQAAAYIALGIALPVAFGMFSEATRFRWAATAAATVYMVFVIAEIQILPLFPATPKLGPVFYPVTHMVPAKFPLLIVLPALALDLLWHRLRDWKSWQVALLSGFVFMAVMVGVEWPFANFMLSKASENRFFGSIYFDYLSRATSYDRRRQFFMPDSGATLYLGLLRGSAYAAVSTWIGLSFGRWMRGVQR